MLDASLALPYGGENRARHFLLLVLDRERRRLYASPRWPDPMPPGLPDLAAYQAQPLMPAPFPEPPLWSPRRPGEPDPARARPGGPFGPGRMNRNARGPGLGPEGMPPRLALRRPLLRTVALEGRPWRLLLMGSDNLTLALAVDLSDVLAEGRSQIRVLALAAPLALLLLAGAGWLLAAQALRPVRILTDVARNLTAKGLDRRIQTPGADREFQALTDVINGMLDRLETSFHQAARFSADAAHELKTPLAILHGQLEQALQRAPAASQEQQTYAALLDEVQRLTGIVRKLLLLAQSDAGHLRLGLEPVDLSQELDALLEDLPLLGPGLSLRRAIEPDVRVRADPDMLRNVLRNLLSNAVRYNRPDGAIACTLRPSDGRAELLLENSVAPGQPLDFARLFERFYRGDRARNRLVDGTGLGLSLAREISRAHGGDLTAEPAGEEGWIRFRLSLPLAPLT